MNRRHLLVAAPLALAGCNSLAGAAIGLSPADQAQVHLNAGKALSLAYAGLDGAANAVEIAIKSGALKGANEQAAGGYLTKAQNTLDAAAAAYKANASADLTAAITTVADLIQAARTLAGK